MRQTSSSHFSLVENKLFKILKKPSRVCISYHRLDSASGWPAIASLWFTLHRRISASVCTPSLYILITFWYFSASKSAHASQQASVNLISCRTGKKKGSCLWYWGNHKAEIKRQSEIGKSKSTFSTCQQWFSCCNAYFDLAPFSVSFLA